MPRRAVCPPLNDLVAVRLFLLEYYGPDGFEFEYQPDEAQLEQYHTKVLDPLLPDPSTYTLADLDRWQAELDALTPNQDQPTAA